MYFWILQIIALKILPRPITAGALIVRADRHWLLYSLRLHQGNWQTPDPQLSECTGKQIVDPPGPTVRDP
jgi:hypothetical protein